VSEIGFSINNMENKKKLEITHTLFLINSRQNTYYKGTAKMIYLSIMLGNFNNLFNMIDLYNVSEVKLTYESNNKNKKKMKVNTSAKIYELMLKNWEQIEYRETFKILLLDISKQALGINTVSMGGLSDTQVDVRMILQAALLANASGIAVCHNHPSGNVKPSFADDIMTVKIQKACKTMDIELIDHLIIAPCGYYSYADESRFE
jgi:DNA repair protein RadC